MTPENTTKLLPQKGNAPLTTAIGHASLLRTRGIHNRKSGHAMAAGTQSKKLALRTAEDIYQELLKNPKDVVLTAEQAPAVFKLFTGQPITTNLVRGQKPRAFLQAALMSAIDGSFAMSFIKSIFMTAMKPGATVTAVIRGLVVTGLKHYYRSLKKEPPVLYKTIITSIAWSHKTYFGLIAGGSLDDL